MDANDVVVQQYARYHILVQLGSILFMDKLAQRISIMTLQFFDPINDAKKYSWGSATLGWLYRHLCKASNKKAKQIVGALTLVQLRVSIQGFHKYAQLQGRCKSRCKQVPLQIDTLIFIHNSI